MRYWFIDVDKKNVSAGILARNRKKSFYWCQLVIASKCADLSDDFEE